MTKEKNLPEFNEEAVLRALHNNLTEAVNKANEQLENDPEADYSYFSIVVNEVVHTFILGGPQISGLDKFIEQVSEENGYDVVSERMSPEADFEEYKQED